MRPSRILNDETLFFGLNRNDIIAIGGLFYVYQGVMTIVGYPSVAIFLALISAIGLISIRLKYRKKIIRDVLFYFYIKFLRCGVYHDPKID